jgi:acetyltransferase-like isoleucine patch superfamily enzyme
MTNRREILKDDPESLELFERFEKLYKKLGESFIRELERLPSMPDLFIDRWERGKLLGFGPGSNIYDNALVIGHVKVGKECWIGPNTILDGSGDLAIGDFCTISAGVHIYTHDNVKQTLSSKQLPIERQPTTIGSNVYVAPNAIITKGVTIGSYCVIAAGSFVNKSFPDHSIIMGQPAKAVGKVILNQNEITFKYNTESGE